MTKIYLVNYYSHLPGDSTCKGTYLSFDKAKKKYLEILKSDKDAVIAEAKNNEEDYEEVYKEALEGTYFRGDCEKTSIMTVCIIEEKELKNVKIGDKIYPFLFGDEEVGEAHLSHLFKTKKEATIELKKYVKQDYEYFENNVKLDLENYNENYEDDYDEKEFIKLRKIQEQEIYKNNCMYGYENSQYFCHKFEEVKIQ